MTPATASVGDFEILLRSTDLIDGTPVGGLLAPHLDDQGRIGIRSGSGLLLSEDGSTFVRLPTQPYASLDLFAGLRGEYLAFGGGTFVLPSIVNGSAKVQASVSGTIALAEEGQPAPGGQIWGQSAFLSTDVNNAGTALFLAETNDGGAIPTGGAGFFTGDANGVQQVLSFGETIDGITISSFIFGSINDGGQIAFFADAGSDSGHYVLDGDDLRPIFTSQTVTPSGIPVMEVVNGDFGPPSGAPSFNNAGEIAAYSLLGDAGGIVIGGGTRPDNVAEVVFGFGEILPDNRVVDPFFSDDSGTVAPPLNDVGQVVSAGTFRDVSDKTGLFVASADEDLKFIAESGTPIPGNRPGVFGSFLEPLVSDNDRITGSSPDEVRGSLVRGPFAINDAGQVAFQADVIGGNNPLDLGPLSRSGLFFWDEDLGLHTIIAPGDIIDGETVALVVFEGSDSFGGTGDDGLNDAGQVAFRYLTTDNNSYLGLWQIPEPATASVVALTGLVLLRRRH
ncbi:MAG: choice-of-anchor tandem repeat NxxGxxAF-containing protein [Planctomycetota bacterium]